MLHRVVSSRLWTYSRRSRRPVTRVGVSFVVNRWNSEIVDQFPRLSSGDAHVAQSCSRLWPRRWGSEVRRMDAMYPLGEAGITGGLRICVATPARGRGQLRPLGFDPLPRATIHRVNSGTTTAIPDRPAESSWAQFCRGDGNLRRATSSATSAMRKRQVLASLALEWQCVRFEGPGRVRVFRRRGLTTPWERIGRPIQDFDKRIRRTKSPRHGDEVSEEKTGSKQYGSGGRIRTCDQVINSHLRYHCATPEPCAEHMVFN